MSKRIGIIAAMQLEMEGLRRLLVNPQEGQVISSVTYYTGLLEGTEVVLAVCGVGKVSAAVCAETMVLAFHVDALINTGVAGTLSPALHIQDLAIARAVVQHDMDCTAIGDPIGYLSNVDRVELPCDPALVSLAEEASRKLGYHTETGVIATGDQFIHTTAQREKIRANFCAIAAEMEGGSIGHVACLNDVPFLVIRAISDEASGTSVTDFPRFAAAAAERSIRLVTALVRRYA